MPYAPLPVKIPSAVVEPAARAALTRFDEQVTHYDVLAGSGVQPASRRG
jgi:hypothetical protein